MPAEIRTLEEGDLFFFYRPRVDTSQVRGREDVQRLFMVTAPVRRDTGEAGPERTSGARKRKRPEDAKIFRLFVVGRKKLPEIREGEAHPEERNWAMNVLTTSDPEEIRRELSAKDYATETRGERHLGAAKPVGEGKYALLQHGGHTELAYVLELPQHAGPAQDEFEIREEASYIVSVKNPDVVVPGFPGGTRTPRYPKRLRQQFGGRRWIDAAEPALLDYENTQIALVGARSGDVEEELGISIDDEAETEQSAEVFRRLRIGREQTSLTPLFEGEFPETEDLRKAEIEPTSSAQAPRRASKAAARFHCEICNEDFERRSQFDRHMATSHPPQAPSAADVERALGGIDFPASLRDLVAHASRQLPSEAPVHALIRALPERQYRDAAEVAIALSEAKGGRPRRTAREAEAAEPPSRRGGRAGGRVRAARRRPQSAARTRRR